VLPRLHNILGPNISSSMKIKLLANHMQKDALLVEEVSDIMNSKTKLIRLP